MAIAPRALVGATRWVALLVIVFCIGCGSSAPIQRIGDPEILRLSSQNEIVLLNFWATWCEPCIKEIPVLMRLHQERPDIQMIGISVDAIENEGAVKKFVSKHGITYPVFLRQGNEFDAAMKQMDPSWKEGLPATFVFKNGERVFSKIGPIQDEQEILNYLK